METWDLLRNAWFLLVGVLLAGYSVLDGFDLGVGALFPFLAKTEDEKRRSIRPSARSGTATRSGC